MEHHRRLIWVFKEQLRQDIQHDSKYEKRDDSGAENNTETALRDLLAKRSTEIFEETHLGATTRLSQTGYEKGGGGRKMSVFVEAFKISVEDFVLINLGDF